MNMIQNQNDHELRIISNCQNFKTMLSKSRDPILNLGRGMKIVNHGMKNG
jgi:hypothetical protein